MFSFMGEELINELTNDGIKQGLTERIKKVYEILRDREVVKTLTDFTNLMGLPVQAASQLFEGKRYLTQIQMYMLTSKTGLNLNWFLTGRGDVIQRAMTDKPELTAQIAQAIVNKAIDPDLAVEIIDELSYKDKVIDRQRSEAQDLSTKLIQVMELVERYQKANG